MHRSKRLLNLLVKECDIINYTWVMGSEQPGGTVPSSREMPSIGIFFFKLSGNKPPQSSLNWRHAEHLFFGIFCRSTRKKTVAHVWSVGWCTDEIVGKVSSSFLFLANLYRDPNCQKEDLWRNWADFFKVCSSLRFMHVPCPSPFPRTTFSLHCLLVAVLRDQILIEVSGRVKSPHLNF